MRPARAPSARVWKRLAREIELSRYRPPWHRRAGFWRGWALAATFALVAAIGLRTLDLGAPKAPGAQLVAQLSAAGGAPGVTARLSADGGALELRAERPVSAGPAQSYELWLLPAEGDAPVSLAVLEVPSPDPVRAGHPIRCDTRSEPLGSAGAAPPIPPPQPVL